MSSTLSNSLLSSQQQSQQQTAINQMSATSTASGRSLSGGSSRLGANMTAAVVNSGQSKKERKRNKSTDKNAADANSVKSRLNHLFDQIEKEFDLLITENVVLKDRVEALEEVIMSATVGQQSEASAFKSILQNKMANNIKRDSMVAASQLSQKIKSTYKLKTSGRIFNKTQSNIRAILLDKYEWHKDGVWFVTTCVKGNRLFIGTASADGTACITELNNSAASGTQICSQITYTGHEGSSVNCIRFHPKYDLILTASGDSGAHIWSPCLEKKSLDEESNETCSEDNAIIKQPLISLLGHTSVVISCDWLSTVDQCVTASWDRFADIYDINTGELIVQLVGHDQDLTDVDAHDSAPLIVTSSHDTTFRLWDFREAIHSVSVFQGHTDCVTSATFFGNDKVISGSDDRTVKVWDLKNMRSPLTNIYVEAPINKLGISQTNSIIAIPLENRTVRLFDCNGNRICRLPRNHHERMVTCVSFAPQSNTLTTPNLGGLQLFTCGFDRKVCWWSLTASDHKS